MMGWFRWLAFRKAPSPLAGLATSLTAIRASFKPTAAQQPQPQKKTCASSTLRSPDAREARTRRLETGICGTQETLVVESTRMIAIPASAAAKFAPPDLDVRIADYPSGLLSFPFRCNFPSDFFFFWVRNGHIAIPAASAIGLGISRKSQGRTRTDGSIDSGPLSKLRRREISINHLPLAQRRLRHT
jgi:hypothetical protein